ncbi:type II secretion system protein [Massilia genomosp. 1]|nr:type II secretion system protein [Massilia genomosp. 1]
MKMQSIAKFRHATQAGFTLIELIVVIVILGILAATALPKFADLGGDARGATMKAAKGSLEAVSAMVHGKYLVTPTATAVSLEGTSVTLANGYPVGNALLLEAAGLKASDYLLITAAGSGATVPTTAAGEVAVVPLSVAGTAKAVKCYVLYKPAVAPAGAATDPTPPVISVDITTC